MGKKTAKGVLMALDPETIIKLQHELDNLRKQHKALDTEIYTLLHSSYPDDLKLYRLKREKLHLKDLMTKIDGLLVPNIIA